MNILEVARQLAARTGNAKTAPKTVGKTVDKSPRLDNLKETPAAKKAEAQALLDPIKNLMAMLVPGGVAVQLASHSPSAESASFIPANLLKGLRGDIAKGVQEEIAYSAKRGFPVYNRALYNHYDIPLFVSPSSGQLMTINPALEKMAGKGVYKLPKDGAEVLLQDIIDPELIELVPELRNTVVRQAKDFEYLQKWAAGVDASFLDAESASKALKQPHPAIVTSTYPKIRADVLAHELQHNIQAAYKGKAAKPHDTSTPEGMAAYRKDWGEREAYASDAAVRQLQRTGVVDLPDFAGAPKIRIQGTNKADPELLPLERLILEALEEGAKEFPYAR